MTEVAHTEVLHDKAQALYHAREHGIQQEREKWQVVVAELQAQLETDESVKITKYSCYRTTVASEFQQLERMHSDARHNEAAALRHARQQGMQEEREKWQTVIADKDARIAELQAQLEKRTP